MDEVAALRAREVSVVRTPGTLTEAEKQAAGLFPVRNKGMVLHNLDFVTRILEKDPSAQIPKIREALSEVARRSQAQGDSELRLMGFPNAPAFYADGRRSVLEIRDAVAAEYGPLPIEALELYFQAFEKAGVMKILEEPAAK